MVLNNKWCLYSFYIKVFVDVIIYVLFLDLKIIWLLLIFFKINCVLDFIVSFDMIDKKGIISFYLGNLFVKYFE